MRCRHGFEPRERWGCSLALRPLAASSKALFLSPEGTFPVHRNSWGSCVRSVRYYVEGSVIYEALTM